MKKSRIDDDDVTILSDDPEDEKAYRASRKRASSEDETQLHTLLDIGEVAELFHTASGELYARVLVEKIVDQQVEQHYEVRAISDKGSGFRRWLDHMYYKQTRGAPSTTAMTQAMAIFSAKAELDGPTEEVFTRTASHDGCLYIDLGTDDWTAIKISPDGWEVVNDCPVHFRRPNGLKPMPVPERGGSLRDLRRFVNVSTDDDWMMLIGWAITVFHPSGPYPILALNGEAGTAKSTSARYLRDLMDPNAAPLRDTPKDIRDLAIAAKNGRVIALDNLSRMPEWLADALCRMATGSGYATRANYTDDQEALFNNRRPVVFNGIEELTTRGDLADRCLVVSLQPISKRDRKTESQMDALWESAKPKIFGALLDAVVAALAGYKNVKLTELPRMADMVVWVTAAEKHLGWGRGSFMEAYTRNRENAVQVELDSSPVASAIRAWVAASGWTKWTGTPEEFYAAIKPFAGELAEYFPRSANSLTRKINRITPALRAAGIKVTSRTSNQKRKIDVEAMSSDDSRPNSDDISDDSDDIWGNSDDIQTQYRRCENPENMPLEGPKAA